MPLISLELLEAHPDNANVMPEPLLEKLIAHIRATGNYPPLIVRPVNSPSLPGRGPGGGSHAAFVLVRATPTPALPFNGEKVRYQILDGHHRAIALRRLNHVHANCEVWDVDDEQAAMLLLTLNRLHGEDDPRMRGELLAKLRQTMDLDAIASRLPDDLSRIEKLIAITRPPEQGVAAPKRLDEMPHAVTFFLSGTQREALFAKLRAVHRDRSAALVALLELDAACATSQPASTRCMA